LSLSRQQLSPLGDDPPAPAAEFDSQLIVLKFLLFPGTTGASLISGDEPRIFAALSG
jgi:hypothetical protein